MNQYLSESVGVNSLGDLNHLYHKLLDKVRSVETKAEQKAQLEQELSEARDTLSVRFLMPFDNHKADSLKEALLQYDDYAHKCRLELGQQEMIGRLNTAIDMIQEQNDKLDSIHSEVRSVNSKVNWLMWL